MISCERNLRGDGSPASGTHLAPYAAVTALLAVGCAALCIPGTVRITPTGRCLLASPFPLIACTPLLSAARQFVSVSVSLFLRDVFFIWIPMIARIGILFFAFLLLGVCLISWICEFLVLIMMRKFWAVISSILFLFLFSFFLGLLLPKC